MTTDDAGRLMLWLRGMAEDMAHDLREAGWKDDEHGLWRDNEHGLGLHIFDAHEKMKKGASNSGASRAITLVLPP